MKDWQRSPEPPSMMGPPTYLSQGSSPISSDKKQQKPSSYFSVNASEETSHRPLRSRTKADVSLGEMSRRVIMQKIHLYDTFGSTPFPIVRSILESCPAKKLYALEEESPHFLPHTGYIWKKLCIKDFRDVTQAAQAGTLPEAEDWRLLHAVREKEVLVILQGSAHSDSNFPSQTKLAAQQEALEAAAARVKEKYASLEADRIAHRARVVSAAATNRLSSNRGYRFDRGARMISGNSNLTAGQKLMRDARKQGNVRMQMTHSVRKTAAVVPPPSQTVAAQPNPLATSPAKRPRIGAAPPPPSSATTESARPPPPRNSQVNSSPTSDTFIHHNSSRNSSSIFINKRRIPYGSPPTRRY